MAGVDLSKQELSGQTLGGKTGHPAAVIAIKNPIEETAVLASDWEEKQSVWSLTEDGSADFHFTTVARAAILPLKTAGKRFLFLCFVSHLNLRCPSSLVWL